MKDHLHFIQMNFRFHQMKTVVFAALAASAVAMTAVAAENRPMGELVEDLKRSLINPDEV